MYFAYSEPDLKLGVAKRRQEEMEQKLQKGNSQKGHEPAQLLVNLSWSDCVRLCKPLCNECFLNHLCPFRNERFNMKVNNEEFIAPLCESWY